MKKAGTVILLFAVAASLAGCGSQPAESEKEAEAAEEKAAEETEEAAEAGTEETAEAEAEEVEEAEAEEAEEAEAEEAEEAAETEEAGEEDDYIVVDWDRNLFTDLGEVISGIEDMDFAAGEATRADIREGLLYDEDLVRLVMINTDDVSLVTPGTYEMFYNICFNREPLLEWMEENGIDSSLYPGMDTDAGRLFVTTTATVTVTED